MILPNGLQISLPHPTPNPGGTMCPYQSLQRRNPRTWKQATLGSSPRPCLHINILQKSLSRQNMSFSNILLFQMNLPQTSSTARNSSRSQLKEMQVILQTCLTTKTHLGVIWELNCSVFWLTTIEFSNSECICLKVPEFSSWIWKLFSRKSQSNLDILSVHLCTKSTYTHTHTHKIHTP